MQKEKKSSLVYSTHPDSVTPEENESNINQKIDRNVTAYIERDRKQRRGKVVTVISKIAGDLKNLQKELQKECGAGGSVKNGTIEIQGDHRDKIATILQKKGYKTKFIGG